MEVQFRRDLNQKLTDMIGTDNSTSVVLKNFFLMLKNKLCFDEKFCADFEPHKRTIHKTEMRFKMTFSRFNAEDSGLKPVIIYGHGGGYVAGSVNLYSRFLTWLAKEVKISITYLKKKYYRIDKLYRRCTALPLGSTKDVAWAIR